MEVKQTRGQECQERGRHHLSQEAKSCRREGVVRSRPRKASTGHIPFRETDDTLGDFWPLWVCGGGVIQKKERPSVTSNSAYIEPHSRIRTDNEAL